VTETDEYDFDLPKELIAQAPTAQRDQSRMLVVHRHSGKIEHRNFRDFLKFLQKGDVLVLNNSRVVRARLYGRDRSSKREFEILLLEENATNDWWAMMRPAKHAPIGTEILLRNNLDEASEVTGTIKETNAEGHRRIDFKGTANLLGKLDQLGHVPLPPYIIRNGNTETKADSERYQTIFATTEGSIAAPTAGLHFTSNVLEQIRLQGVAISFLTLHVGAGTFAPVKSELLSDHRMHEERFEISAESIRTIHEAKLAGRRVVAIGTTTVRVLESLVLSHPKLISPNIRADVSLASSIAGRTKIFIYPPYQFQVVDVLLTNFHLPRSTLLMLASAFVAPGKTTGRDIIFKAYAEAIQEKYRFFSYGDAMLIL
jgi:S-adenosylmethionine:tRNA ribosyltransferase-isomerase